MQLARMPILSDVGQTVEPKVKEKLPSGPLNTNEINKFIFYVLNANEIDSFRIITYIILINQMKKIQARNDRVNY
jgi:hypothetical protein